MVGSCLPLNSLPFRIKLLPGPERLQKGWAISPSSFSLPGQGVDKARKKGAEEG